MENFQFFIENSLLFNSIVKEEDKIIVKGLLLEACQQIELHGDILGVLPNIEVIICKPPEGDHAGDIRSPFGGGTLRMSWRDLVIYNPLGLRHRETQLFILAHEFAHVFLKHTANPHPTPPERENCEIEACRMAVKWGFEPHNEDIDKCPDYKKYLERISRENLDDNRISSV